MQDEMVKPTLSVLYGQTVQLYLLFPSPDASVFDEPEPCLVNIECISPSCNDNHYELLYTIHYILLYYYTTSELTNASLTVTPRLQTITLWLHYLHWRPIRQIIHSTFTKDPTLLLFLVVLTQHNGEGLRGNRLRGNRANANHTNKN